MTNANKYLRPKTTEEALQMARLYENSFRYIAGGTDVIVNKFQGNEESTCLIDLSGIKSLKEIMQAGNQLLIGSLVKLDDLKHSLIITSRFPDLLEAARSVASPVLRKTATLGGNILCENRCSFYNQSEWWRTAVGYCLKCDGDICIATGGKKSCFSKFVSDMAPVLISVNAKIELIDEEGERTISLEEIYTSEGINPRKLSKFAIIKSIVLPLSENYTTYFRKLRPRAAVDFTSLTAAISRDDAGKIRIVLGGVDPGPVLIEGTMNDDRRELIKQALKKARIVDNDFYSRAYRRDMIPVFLEEGFRKMDESYTILK
jgi:4-hydroxybenzoyl-CoA reductase subunit beta